MKAALTVLTLALSACATNGNGDYYLQTPKVSTPLGKSGFTIWLYGVIGVSKTEQRQEPFDTSQMK